MGVATCTASSTTCSAMTCFLFRFFDSISMGPTASFDEEEFCLEEASVGRSSIIAAYELKLSSKLEFPSHFMSIFACAAFASAKNNSETSVFRVCRYTFRLLLLWWLWMWSLLLLLVCVDTVGRMNTAGGV